MSALDRLKGQQGADKADRRLKWFTAFGVSDNPFPPASHTADNPHMETEIDEEIVDHIAAFRQDHTSRVVVIEGMQGTGKTNLLNYYNSRLIEALGDSESYYVIRYFGDPEPAFDSVMRRLVESLGTDHLVKIAKKLSAKKEAPFDRIKGRVRNVDFGHLLEKLREADKEGDGDDVSLAADLAIEWLTGMRVLNRHRDTLGVKYRLDTLESRTQAFRDLVEVSHAIGLLDGIFLLLDELEKLDGMVPQGVVLKYLFALRAVIDALPQHLFLMVALTPVAKNRYFQMVPALKGRMQNTIQLQALRTDREALELFRFYMETGREHASTQYPKLKPGTQELLSRQDVKGAFDTLSKQAFGDQVTQRDFLQRLHSEAQKRLKTAAP